MFNDNGERQELNIDTIEEYQRVKRMYSEFYPDVTKGQDLKPAQVYWEAGNKKFNLFDMPAVIHAIQVRSVGKVDKATDLELQKNIQNTFLLLDKGFMPLTEEVQRETVEVLKKYPTLIQIKSSGNSNGDPFLIATALLYNGIVVTDEKLGDTKNQKAYKIPNVCNELNIEWMGLRNFIDEIID